MVKDKKYILMLFLMGITLLVALVLLKGVKHFSIRKIESHKNIETYKTEIFEHNKIKYEIGYIESYPLLKILNAANHEWRVINLRGLIKDVFPSNTYYYGFKAIDNTVWFYELETCIECDGSNKLHNINIYIILMIMEIHGLKLIIFIVNKMHTLSLLMIKKDLLLFI